jgi:hypothetical protein
VFARAADGVNVAVSPLYVTAPVTAPPGPVTVKVEPVIVAAFIAMLKVALMGVLTATFRAPFAGIVDTTEGTVTVSWPQPATKMTDRTASQYVKPNLFVRICNLSSGFGAAVLNTRHSPDKLRTRSTHDGYNLMSFQRG